MAVINFDSPGLEENVARTTTYLLESKLGNSPLVELVERNQIQKVLDELQYQQSGLTADNAVQIGQQLNAEYMLIGSINKLGNLIIITAKLVNVETAQIEGTREVQCSNATIETISEMVSILAPTIAKY
jgi:TolB-like protein